MKTSFLIHKYSAALFQDRNILVNTTKEYLSEGLQHDEKSLHSFCNLVLTKTKGWPYQLLKHSTGTQATSHRLQKPLWDHQRSGYCHQRWVLFLYSHSQLHAPTASWSWAVGKLQLLTENKLCRRKVSVRSPSCSPFPVTALHGQRCHRCT